MILIENLFKMNIQYISFLKFWKTVHIVPQITGISFHTMIMFISFRLSTICVLVSERHIFFQISRLTFKSLEGTWSLLLSNQLR